MKKLRSFLTNEDGQGMVEYGLIIALVAVVLIGALTILGGDDGLKGLFGRVTDALGEAGVEAE